MQRSLHAAAPGGRVAVLPSPWLFWANEREAAGLDRFRVRVRRKGTPVTELSAACHDGGCHTPPAPSVGPCPASPRAASLSFVQRKIPFFPVTWDPVQGRMACLSGPALRVRDLDVPKGDGPPHFWSGSAQVRERLVHGPSPPCFLAAAAGPS